MPASTTIFVAHDSRRGISAKGKIPWPQLTQDMEMFQKTTEDNIIIMGRKTWDSLPKRPLPKRINIIITNNAEDYSQMRLFQQYGAGVLSSNDLEQAIITAHSTYPDKKVFVIGGEQIYQTALEKHLVNNIVVTEIEANFSCDRFFPKVPSYFIKTGESQPIEQQLTSNDPNMREPAPTLKYKVSQYQLVPNQAEANYIQLMG